MKRLEYNKVTIYDKTFKSTLTPGELMLGQDKDIIQFLCPCGCGKEIYLTSKEWCDVRGKNWSILEKDGKVTLWPSVNATGFECKSHFWIKDNKVVWV